MKLDDALGGARTVFLDSAPVIYYVEGTARYQPVADALFDRIRSGTLTAVTSSMTLAECLVIPYRNGDLGLVEAFRKAITTGVHTSYVGVDEVAEQASALRARYNLGLVDALQFAAAIASKCDAFVTNDERLKRVQEIPVVVLEDLEP